MATATMPALTSLTSSGRVGEVLPWNIVDEPPFGSQKKELLPMEGSWRLVATNNYDAYLAAVGVTPLMAAMVMRSDYMITIYEDIDHMWKILTETSIKAKSIRGYKCRNYKMTANKFLLNEAKPESLEDWDPRLVVTTVTLVDDRQLVFTQVAEKDQKFCKNSVLTVEGQGELLTMTLETEDGVKATRTFVKHRPPDRSGQGMAVSRKISAPF